MANNPDASEDLGDGGRRISLHAVATELEAAAVEEPFLQKKDGSPKSNPTYERDLERILSHGPVSWDGREISYQKEESREQKRSGCVKWIVVRKGGFQGESLMKASENGGNVEAHKNQGDHRVSPADSLGFQTLPLKGEKGGV